jgi:iron complex outermembrane receptor protein
MFSAINSIKIRGIGITGQQDIGVSYPSIPLYLISNRSTAPIWKYFSMFRPQPCSNLKWEQTTLLMLVLIMVVQ